MTQRRAIRAIGLIVCLAPCPRCERVEWMRDAGTFFYQCDECMALVARPLRVETSTVPYPTDHGDA